MIMNKIDQQKSKEDKDRHKSINIISVQFNQSLSVLDIYP